MQTNSAPIKIVHIDLDQHIGSNSTPVTGDLFVVFWTNQVPVGHVFTPAEQESSVQELAQLSVAPEAIQAARQRVTNGDTVSVSVVICTRDRPDELERCLAAFSKQTRSPEQILVVDNASKDERTMLVARQAGVDYVREERPGLDVARNTGARIATGDIIAYIDDDVVVHSHWAERLVAAFDSEEIWALTGLVLPGELETDAQQIFERQWGFGRGFVRKDFGPLFYETHRHHGCPAWEIGAGASMAFRRTVFASVGGFDERLDVGAAGCSGDSEFWYRILHHGGTCRYDPKAVAFHYHRRSIEALASQIRAYMRGHAAALLVQYERTRDRGNLRRLFLTLPAWYARRIVKRLVHGQVPENRFLREEIVGCMQGVMYYLKAARPASSHARR